MEIVPYRPELAPAFRSLNRAWIERFFALEPADLKTLDDPEGAIVAPGGEIFFALVAGTVAGTAAAVPVGPGAFELAKMAVSPEHQGSGIGQALGQAVIDWVRSQRATRLFLLTNSSLGPALRLYRRLGFQDRPLPSHTDYARADVYMEYPL